MVVAYMVSGVPGCEAYDRFSRAEAKGRKRLNERGNAWTPYMFLSPWKPPTVPEVRRDPPKARLVAAQQDKRGKDARDVNDLEERGRVREGRFPDLSFKNLKLP
mmetsp:Transcript_27519/g.89642  ORF Transcript_27519/g.89642 Transcript_27519/m.89642 type:complete len:104 (-) Transcript_27519:118-429(-)